MRPGIGVLTIANALRSISTGDPDSDWRHGRLHPGLGWTHYRAFLKVGHREARDFYEIEAARSGWYCPTSGAEDRRSLRLDPHNPSGAAQHPPYIGFAEASESIPLFKAALEMAPGKALR